MKRTLQLLLSLMMVFAVAKAADVFDDIGSAIRTGDARQIARYFNNNVDLTVFNQEEVYSKAQAEMVLKDFSVKILQKLHHYSPWCIQRRSALCHWYINHHTGTKYPYLLLL